MHTHARAALAVCLLAVAMAGCQSARMPSFALWNRSEDASALARARTAEAPARGSGQPDSGGTIQQVSYDRAGAEHQRRQMIEDALSQARTADARSQLELARSHYERVLDFDPAHADALHALGILADKQGDYRTAETHYLRALRVKPDDANLLSDMGYSYFLQARRHDAEFYLREALKYDPQHAKARGNLDLLFNEQNAFETYRQLLGEREAAARMNSLFPQSGSGVMRTAATTPAPPTYGYDHSGANAHSPLPAAQPQYGAPAGAPSWPQVNPHAAYRQSAAEHSSVDHLRAEMERERLQAAALRQRGEHPAFPAVARDAFSQTAPRSAWPAEQPPLPGAGSAHPGAFDLAGRPSAPSFSNASAPETASPYGQWVEPPRSGRVSQTAPAAGAGPEAWPHAPDAAWGNSPSTPPYGSPTGRPVRTAVGDHDYGTSYNPGFQAGAAPQQFARQASPEAAPMTEVNRAAQRIGMEGSLFPAAPANALAARPVRQPDPGVSPAGAASAAENWNTGAPSWNGGPDVQTVGAWQRQPSNYAAAADSRGQQSPGIVITPGMSGTTSAPASAPASPVDRPWNGGSAPAGYPAAGYGPGTQQMPPAESFGGASRWPQQPDPAPAASYARPAASEAVPSYWQNAPGGTGWIGQ